MTGLWRVLPIAVLFVTCGLPRPAHPEERPAGLSDSYKLLYAQDFSGPGAIRDFVMTDPGAWSVSKEGDRPALELTRQSRYTPPYRSPLNIALIGPKVFGDCVIEAECIQTGREYGHRDMVFVFGFQSPAQFYYAHIATQADEHANNIFLVNNAPRTKIARETNRGNDWGLNVWHKVRIERKASDGTIRVFFDDMRRPIMEAEDKTFGPGWVGFGSFDDTGKVAHVRVWGPDAEEKQAPPFPK